MWSVNGANSEFRASVWKCRNECRGIVIRRTDLGRLRHLGFSIFLSLSIYYKYSFLYDLILRIACGTSYVIIGCLCHNIAVCVCVCFITFSTFIFIQNDVDVDDVEGRYLGL